MHRGKSTGAPVKHGQRTKIAMAQKKADRELINQLLKFSVDGVETLMGGKFASSFSPPWKFFQQKPLQVQSDCTQLSGVNSTSRNSVIKNNLTQIA